ncbi:Lipopolysaccharide core heptosyltransferase RfaQ [Marinomonas aquimarina]|uniref:Lipopolysaccharide core heptosyltransferase RfaQ n=1 Tax=Marinomonas aquimarina TaxID=295068 RepID=A0A1A8TBJ9_9GAMM|nr:glycosyltransferase family 9 protein [Marinomonas aquimarina]SBS30344.1 Lipopolysaccharide core heptosyltransferase RfaQ [Marinomonas aquimarina]
MDQTITNIAVIRLSAIGDVCHAMAVIAALQKRYPKAQITWITGPVEAQLVRLLPGVKVHVYDKKSGVSGMLALRKALSSIQFDVLLHLQWSLRASLLSKMLRAKRRIGFKKTYSREKQHWFVNEFGEEPRSPHVLDSFLAIAAKLQVTDIHLPLALTLPDAPGGLPETYVVINPSASKAERNWTLDGYQAVIDWCAEQGLAVVLTGGPSDAEKAMAAQLHGSHVTDLVGQTNLAQMLSVLQGANWVLSPDTGPAHMATLVGTPVVGLYAHSNPQRTGPFRDLDKVVSVYEQCAQQEYGKPVSELPWASRVHDPKAMQQITAEQVIAQLVFVNGS